MDVFKKGVLDLAITQINEHTDIVARYYQHKAGRVITGFTFTIKPKKPPRKKTKKEEQLDLLESPKAVFSDDILKISADFDGLANENKELILKNIRNELSGLKLSDFTIELSVYKATGTASIFQKYKDYFSRGLALLGYY
jgi:plasmid replication initiation protein